MEPAIRRFFQALHEETHPQGPVAAPPAIHAIEAAARSWGISPLAAGLRLSGREPPGGALGFDPVALDPEHPALQARGLEPNLCRDREIGFVVEAGQRHSGWLAVTIFDILGRRAGWTFRRVEETPSAPRRRPRPRWSLSPGFPRGRPLYNLDRAWPSLVRSETALLVEGPFDALHLHQAGWTNAVALLGNRLTGWHVDLLLTVGVSQVVLLLDNDHGGRQGRDWALRGDGRLDQFRVADLCSALPPGKDPDQLAPEALADLLGKYRPG